MTKKKNQPICQQSEGALHIWSCVFGEIEDTVCQNMCMLGNA